MKLKRQVKQTAVAIGGLALAMSMAANVQAGGSSDTSGEGFHCYVFFELPDNKFAQAMVNDDKPKIVKEKIEEFIDKYTKDEGGVLTASVGNIEQWDKYPGVCGPDIPEPEIECPQQCRDIIDASIALCGPNFGGGSCGVEPIDPDPTTGFVNVFAGECATLRVQGQMCESTDGDGFSQYPGLLTSEEQQACAEYAVATDGITVEPCDVVNEIPQASEAAVPASLGAGC